MKPVLRVVVIGVAALTLLFPLRVAESIFRTFADAVDSAISAVADALEIHGG